MSETGNNDLAHVQNTWAKDVKGTPVHISVAPSGRKGYFCLGCSKDMEAVQFKDPGHASYFRHQARDATTGERKCTYSDETHRHKIAKEILQRIKCIKVPAVHKYPPQGASGRPMVLQRARVIEAVTVRNELYFFEDMNGVINWSRKLPIGAHELVKPDVIFFDKEDKPTLFIELEATHRVSDEKKARLRHLGIDAVEVILPTGPFEEIEEAFRSTTKTKWLYNDKEQQTRYVQPPIRNTEDVPPPDELQRGVFEESYACRKASVNNLVRAIERCLASESYRGVEAGLRSELQRVAENAERVRLELQGIREERRAGIEGRYAREIERLEEEEAKLGERIKEFSERRSGLEKRYRAKRGRLEEAAGEIRGLEAEENRNPEQFGSEESYLERAIDQARKSIHGTIEQGRTIRRDHEGNQEVEQGRFGAEVERIAGQVRRLDTEEGDFPNWAKQQEQNWAADLERLVREEEACIQELEERARLEQESLGAKADDLEREFEEERKRLVGTGLEPIGQPRTEIERKIKAVADLGEAIARYEEVKAERERYERARKSVTSGTYEGWYRPGRISNTV